MTSDEIKELLRQASLAKGKEEIALQLLEAGLGLAVVHKLANGTYKSQLGNDKAQACIKVLTKSGFLPDSEKAS